MRRTLSLLAVAVTLFSTLAVVTSTTPAGATGVAHPADECIVSLSPTATETLYAIGAGPQVEAVDTDSDYPPTGLPSTRIDPFSPNAEEIATICAVTKAHPSTKPSLVVVYYNANHIVEKLRQLDVQVAYQQAPAGLSGAYHQMVELGILTGHRTAANAMVASLTAEITKDVASITAHPKKVVSTYYEISPPPYIYSATTSTFIGEILRMLTVFNIADGVSQPGDEGYPALTSEYVIAKNPRLAFLADTSTTINAYTFDHRAGWTDIPAIKYGHVVDLNDDIASRWGPRVGDLVGTLTAAVKADLADSRLWKK
jgi:iron complex transport system substrate-binding protein